MGPEDLLALRPGLCPRKHTTQFSPLRFVSPQTGNKILNSKYRIVPAPVDVPRKQTPILRGKKLIFKNNDQPSRQTQDDCDLTLVGSCKRPTGLLNIRILAHAAPRFVSPTIRNHKTRFEMPNSNRLLQKNTSYAL